MVSPLITHQKIDTSYYTPKNVKELLWMFKLWKKVLIVAYILLDIRIPSHTLKLMKIMPYHSIAHKTVFEITRGLLLALGF